MITLWTLSPCQLPVQGAHLYRVAGQSVLTDAALRELCAFEFDGPLAIGLPPLISPQAEARQDRLIYRGPGWIGGRWRQVECHSAQAGTRLTVQGAGSYLILRDGRTILRTEANPADDHAAVIETLLGPTLVLALALHDSWSLHASAVVSGGRAIAFLGESGSGKSTLAAFLGEGGAPAWSRMTDDLLPVALRAGDLQALPHFPQLKLPPDCQPSLGMPERMPLAALYVLGDPGEAQGATRIEPLSGREAGLALVRHTVASRLFDKDLLSRHLAFCAQAAAAIPVRHLSYPRRHAVLPHVRDAITADLEAV